MALVSADDGHASRFAAQHVSASVALLVSTEHHCAGASFDASKSGAEWWTQCIDPDDDIGLHWDRDYDLQEEQGLLLHCR